MRSKSQVSDTGASGKKKFPKWLMRYKLFRWFVYKFIDNGLGEGTTLYKSNAKGSAKTNGGGVAHFDLKSPDDFAPSSVGAQDEETFYFAVFDANEDLLGYVAQTVKTGDKLTVKLSLDEQPEQQD